MRACLKAACVVAALLAISCASIADDQWFDTPVDAGPEASGPDGVVDVMEEALPEPDAEPDIGPEVEPDPESSSEPEDGGEEEPPPDTCTPTSTGGECNLVEQCGCPPAHYCRWSQSDSCTIVETCYAALPGSGTHGQACFSAYDCASGHSCLGSSSDSGICYKWCRDVTDCPAGKTCEVTVDFSLSEPCEGTSPGPLSACSL